MGLKHHTVIIVPHARARFRKLRVTNRQIVIATSVAALLLLVSAFTTWSFFANSIDQDEIARLAEENSRLREVNQEFESSVLSLRNKISDFEERTRQLAIVAGLDSMSFGEETGVGGGEILSLSDDAALDTLQKRAGGLASGLDTIAQGLDSQTRLISSTPAISPVKGILTSGFGYRTDPMTGQRALHRAIDISTMPGRPVVAAADGIVVKARRAGHLGNGVVVSHGYGLTTTYGHLSRFNVEAGDEVRRGDVIGYVGNTGRATGYHLHYEVRKELISILTCVWHQPARFAGTRRFPSRPDAPKPAVGNPGNLW